MTVKETSMEGLLELQPRVFEDERGKFLETYNEKVFEKILPGIEFVQDNQSYSTKGVLRGLHLQTAPHAQGKLVRVSKGSVLDVAVDIRPDSPTFGKHESFILSAEKNNILYVPEGMAHGFLALEECVLHYRCTSLYEKSAEAGIIWNDPTLNIKWGIEDPLLSEKDLKLTSFEEFKETFL